MGATTFYRFGFGATIKEAYYSACEEVQEEVETNDGYSNDLNSKPGFTEVQIPAGSNPEKYARWIEQAARTLNESMDAKNKKRIMLFIPDKHHQEILRLGKIYNDKYGKALGIKVNGKGAKEYRLATGRKGKRGKVFLFIGVASN